MSETDSFRENKQFMEALTQVLEEDMFKAPPYTEKWFFRQVVGLSGYEPRNSRIVAEEIADFFDRHSKGSDDVNDFLSKCTFNEKHALEKLAHGTDKELREADRSVSRRSFIRRASTVVAGVSLLGLAVSDSRAKEPKPEKSESEQAKPAQEAAHFAMLAGLVGAGSVAMREYLIKSSTNAYANKDFIEKGHLKEMIEKLLGDTNAMLSAANDEMYARQLKAMGR